jgi:hypothetical protein
MSQDMTVYLNKKIWKVTYGLMLLVFLEFS